MPRRSLLVLIAAFMILTLFTHESAHANSAEPPSLIIIVPNPLDDLAVTFHAGDGSIIDANKSSRAWETYYAVYRSGMVEMPDIRIEINTGGENFEFLIDRDDYVSYNTMYTLDIKNRTLTEGRSAWRIVSLIVMRLIFTLLIEGLCFYVIGFRKRRSWLMFILVNLITQGWLNISLSGLNPFNSYGIISLIFAEVVILIIELIAFLLLLKEHGKLRRAAYVLLANIFSLMLGGYLITNLPL